MRLLIPILVFILTAPIALRAQLDPASLALRAYQSKDFEKAKELIDITIDDEMSSTRARTWVFRGYIYKDIYKLDQLSHDGREKRDESIRSYKRALELDTDGEFTNDCMESLRFLSTTIYNDAARSLEEGDFKPAVEYYEKYKELAKFRKPDLDFTGRDIEFKSFHASKLSLLHEKEQTNNLDSLSKEIVRLYEEVIALDSNDVQANYNLAIHYYNQGVHIIDNMDYELPFEELFLIQEKVMVLFQNALPYMLKAYMLTPGKSATLQGLSGIYFGLNDIEKSEFYQKKLEELEGK